MSNFEVKIQPIFIKPHPNADKLEIGNIGSPEGWQVIVQKGRFVTGDMCAYIGENAVVPEWLLKFYGYWNEEQNKGMLGGSKGDRVRGIRLRGEFSLGIVLPVKETNPGYYCFPHDLAIVAEDLNEFSPNENVADFLGIIKFIAPIPVCMAGEVYNFGTHIGVNYDIENIKNYPNILVEGEDVQASEKLHGTFIQICVLPFTQEYHHDDHFEFENSKTGHKAYFAISSKGLGGRGLFLKNNDRNKDNIYVRTAIKYFERLTQFTVIKPFTVCGEVFGNGVQDLTYGYSQGQTDFRLFDVYVGHRGIGNWLCDEALELFIDSYNIHRVPILYRGPFKRSIIDEFAQHTKSVFDPNQIREGVVVKPIVDRFDPVIGRVALKVINEDYLTRKGNTTEYN